MRLKKTKDEHKQLATFIKGVHIELHKIQQGSKMMAQKWISEKRYQELISCAHGGWYQDDVMVKPIHLV